MCLASVESDHHAMRLSYDRWRTAPMHLGASAKVLLAHLDDAHAERILADPPPHPTGGAEIPTATLRRRSRRRAATGTSSPTASSTAGATAVAAPVLDARGGPLAGLSLAGPTPRVRAALERIVPAVTAGAATIARPDRGAVTVEPAACARRPAPPLPAEVVLDGRTLTPATVAGRRARATARCARTAAPGARRRLARGARGGNGRDRGLRHDDGRGRAAQPPGRARGGSRHQPRCCAAAPPRRQPLRARHRPRGDARPAQPARRQRRGRLGRAARRARGRPRAGVVPVVRDVGSLGTGDLPELAASGSRSSARARPGPGRPARARRAPAGGRRAARMPGPATRWPCRAATP